MRLGVLYVVAGMGHIVATRIYERICRLGKPS
jgi:hypothetical protein